MFISEVKVKLNSFDQKEPLEKRVKNVWQQNTQYAVSTALSECGNFLYVNEGGVVEYTANIDENTSNILHFHKSGEK